MYLIDRYNDENCFLRLFTWTTSFIKCFSEYINARLRDKGVIFVTKRNDVFGSILFPCQNG